MLVGRVEKVFVIKKDNSRIVHIKPATNFRNMQYVYAIKNDYMEERRKLEDTTEQALKQAQQKK
jgi:cell shape-determining protein MreC